MKRRLLISVTLILGFISIKSNAESFNSSDSIFEEDPYYLLMGEADDAIKTQNWEAAIARLNDALAVKPSSPSNVLIYSNLGAVYATLGQDSVALQNYNRAIEIAPNMLTPILGRGKLYISVGKDREAYADFTKAIEIDSICTEARFYRGMMALYGGILPMAEEDFKVLESISPRSIDTAIAMSSLYSMTGRDSEAVPYLKNLVKSNPAPEFYASLAGCYLNLDWLNEASEIISEGLKLYPDDPELYYYRAWLNKERYRIDDAHEDAKKALKLGANPAKINELFR